MTFSLCLPWRSWRLGGSFSFCHGRGLANGLRPRSLACAKAHAPRRGAPMHVHGIIPPVATPMKDNEDLDLPRLKWFLDHLIASGVHGIFVLGTNSEFYALDEREKQEVIATAV